MRKKRRTFKGENFYIKEGFQIFSEPDYHDEKWYNKYIELVAFKKEFGHTRVPENEPKNKSLGGWVARQRYNKIKSNMPEWRKELLVRLNFEFKLQEPPETHEWMFCFEKLKEYFLFNGHSNVPQKYKYNGFRLGAWVSTQRGKKDKLSEERLKLLDDLNFSWKIAPTPIKVSFEKRYYELQEFIQTHQEFDWKKLKAVNKSLYSWLEKKRHNRNRLKQDELKKLKKIGFPFMSRESPKEWEERYEELLTWIKMNGKSKFTRKESQYGIGL